MSESDSDPDVGIGFGLGFGIGFGLGFVPAPSPLPVTLLLGPSPAPMPQVDLETTLRLVRGAQAGDRVALEALFERYLPRVQRIVSLRLGCPLKDFAGYEDLV